MKLKSEYGNIVKVTDDPTKQKRLIEQGYTPLQEDKQEDKPVKKQASKKQ